MLDTEISTIDLEKPGEIGAMPRRQFLRVSSGDAALSQMRFLSFKVSRLYAVQRFFAWLRLLVYFAIFTSFDIVLRRDHVGRRAQRLRKAFEGNGGSFVKLGMHLSMRVDFMPFAYSSELSRMADRMAPFPIQQATKIVERSTGKPLGETFRRFDPQPIASTTVACIYQAILHSGEKVIVKVRRPGIGEQFMADILAFDWLLTLAELLTIFRPGFTEGMRAEFRDLLLQELDFIQEARRQDAFRRAAAKSRKKFFSAPRVYLALSDQEVVVEEFASGMWLWELIAALEQGNQAVLTHAHAMNILPEKVAKRLLWVNYWSWDENLFFHADPHPNNIIIGQNSKLYFTNFTATGALSSSKRQAMRQNLYYAQERDPQNMARATLVLMEPLPPVDLIELTQEMETFNWQLLHALEAHPASLKWQERTSAIQWMGFIQMARKYGIVIDVHVLRLLRSTMMFEAIAVRLDHDIDYVRQYRKFNRYRAEQSRRRVMRTVVDQLNGKTNEQLVIRLDRIAQTAEGLYFRTRHMLSLPTANFNALMSKWSFAIYTLVLFLVKALGVTVLAFLIFLLPQYLTGGQPVDWLGVFRTMAANPLYQIALLLLIFSSGRTVLFRMDDKEI
jgi:predicted unusual protein kinase regulating ubiquinone biosynthesis (AarF/ABC1/UbiB family)